MVPLSAASATERLAGDDSGTGQGQKPAGKQGIEFRHAASGGLPQGSASGTSGGEIPPPIICLIDTPGAFCGVEAEERGQGEAIARNIAEFMMLKTPVISVVLGEAGSGGALALGVCDALAMLENALYSVISPRGAASILWKDASREQEACEVMQITAEDMVRFGVAEAIIPEPEAGAQGDIDKISANIKEYLAETITEKLQKDIDVLQKERYTKFRKIGVFEEN